MNKRSSYKKSRRIEHNATLRVLIFEDNDIIRTMLKELLVDLGYDVSSFSNPGLCPVHDSVGHNCPLDAACADIIISDVNMPIQSGLELMNGLKQKGCKAKYRALMSGDWTHSNLRYAKELGCRVFHKPFNFREILQWLDGCSDRINPERKLYKLPIKKL